MGKITNEQDHREDIQDCNRVAATLAVHLVSQVLDEACVIVNSTEESGQPWAYFSMLKNFKDNGIGLNDDEDGSFEASKGDSVNENKIEIVAKVVATSTPQKIAAKQIESSGETTSSHNDSTLIGQGDEEIEGSQSDMTNSTSLFINHLFDMSEVERDLICDDTGIKQSNSEPNTLLADAMNMIIDSYVANASLPLVELPILVENIQENMIHVSEQVSSTDHSEFSFLTDAYVTEITNNVALYIDEDVGERSNGYEDLQNGTINEIKQQADEEVTKVNAQANDFQLYENSYTTMNRDYDLCSEEDEFPILQDPKEMTLQEVELLTANTSDEESTSVPKRKEEEATVSGISGSRPNTLARRCRYQGAKLFSCLRGWWRRKAPGKRKVSRISGVAVCPLSPDARRRTSSLLDNRLLRSPSPSRPVMWKFNTVNEALVNSNRWKDYTFDVTVEDDGEL